MARGKEDSEEEARGEEDEEEKEEAVTATAEVGVEAKVRVEGGGFYCHTGSTDKNLSL